jgi:hypothetical protein
MAFKMKDYVRTEEILNLLTEEKRAGLDPLYIELLEKAQKAVTEN